MLYLRRRLPEYMVPSVLVELDRLPLTANGKIDRKGLPEPGVQPSAGSSYVAAGSEVERVLSEIWSELLGVERVGVTDNFFELGGHSLLTMRMISYVKRKFMLSIPIHVMFQLPSISELSKYIELSLNMNAVEENITTFDLLNI